MTADPARPFAAGDSDPFYLVPVDENGWALGHSGTTSRPTHDHGSGCQCIDWSGSTAIPDERVRMARGVIYDVGEDQLRTDLLARIERLYGAVRAGVRGAALAHDLRRAADLAETDPVDHLRVWLAKVEADARVRLEQPA